MKITTPTCFTLVAILFSSNFCFAQNNPSGDTTKVIAEPPPKIEEIYDVVEVEPSFFGGDKAMQQYIKDSVRYPTEAIKNKEQGRVYVRFVVEKDGSITNVVIARGVSPALDAEAISVVKAMPNWSPGKQRGKPVRTRVVVPILFKF